jgi:hypothetical protein
MNRIDRLGGLIGMAVAALLTWYAYYSNSHPNATRLSELAYILLFPSSIGLMATENATVLSQAIIVAIVIFANGGFYALLSAILRTAFGVGRATP